MNLRFSAGLFSFFSFKTFKPSILVLMVLSSNLVYADTVWDIQAARQSFPNETITGYFDYNSDSGSITNWSVVANGYFAVNTNFVPPYSHNFQPCSNGCSSSIDPSFNGLQSIVSFQDSASNNSSPSFYAGLYFSGDSSILSGTSNINLADYGSSAVAYNYNTNPIGYTTFPVTGTLFYGGTVLTTQGGTAAAPTNLIDVVGGIGQINSYIGGSYGNESYYSFNNTNGAEWATVQIAGADPSSTYAVELTSQSMYPESLFLNSADNFMAPILVPFSGQYTIGVIANSSIDPNLSITFSAPVSVAAVPIPAAFWLFGSIIASVGLFGRKTT
jgi:hypothetical protein